MRFHTYSKYSPELADAVDLQSLLEKLADFLLQSGFAGGKMHHPYWGELGGDEDRSMDALRRYPWPGNVRELQNSMERAVALAQYEKLTVQDLPDRVQNPRPPPASSPSIPASCIIGSIWGRWLSKKRWKLSGSGHSSMTMIWPSAP